MLMSQQQENNADQKDWLALKTLELSEVEARCHEQLQKWQIKNLFLKEIKNEK